MGDGAIIVMNVGAMELLLIAGICGAVALSVAAVAVVLVLVLRGRSAPPR